MVRLAAIVLVLGLAFSVLGGGPSPSASIIHPKPTSYDIREDFDLVHVADFAGMSCGAFASQSDSNGFVHYAYVSHGNLYYGVEGLAGNPAIVSAGTVSCDPIDLALKPNGSAVIGWIDIRNAYSASDGSAAGYDLFVASEDSGWSETLVTASTDQRVLTFQMDLDSLGTIHVAYDRMTVAAWPYDPVLYYAKSPAWQEVAVSSAGVWTRPSLAVDSGNHAHVAWSYTGNIENVWYATDVNGWTNLQVDQNQSSNYWDDRMNPSLAIDMSGAVHVIWEDYRNSDPSGPTPGQVEIWHASSANGWANSELVLPDDAAPARFKHYPVLTIDSTNRSHVVWMEWNDNGNLYYANSTDWNRAIKITNASTNLGYAEQLPSHPVEVRNGRLTVVYSDARSGMPALWRKDDWDLGPDVTPPIAGPLANRTIGRATGGRLQAAGSWDNDRIASYDWRFTGPSTVVASGYDVTVNLPLTGRYAGILEVRDPAGFSATTNFTLDVIPEASTTGWILDRPLSSVPGSNNWVTVFPWDGTAFPVVFWGAIYLRMGMRGEVLQQVTLMPNAPRETAAFDGAGNVHTVGFDGVSLEYTKASPSGANLVPPTTLPLGAYYPQQPYLTVTQGALWLAWIDLRNGAPEIYLASLDLNGNLRWGPTRISNNPGNSMQPILTAVGSSLWIVWRDDREFADAAYASRLNLTTMAFDFSERRLGDGSAWGAKALASGGLALLHGASLSKPYVGRFNASGDLAAPEVRLGFDNGQGSLFGGIAVDPNENVYAAWWDDASSSGSAIRYEKVLANGTVDPVGGVRIHSVNGGSYPSMSAVVGPDGEPRIVYGVETPSGTRLLAAIGDSIPPVARISLSGTLRAGAAIRLNGTLSSDNFGIASYSWHVQGGGGGADYTGSSVTIRVAAGVYAVTLEVQDLANNTAVASTSLTVAPDTVPPVAVITGPVKVTEGDTITYDGLASADDGAISRYQWSVAGPATANGEGATFRFLFPVRGNYSVQLEVTDFGGNTASTVVDVRVRDRSLPTLAMQVPRSVYEGTSVTFDATGSTDESGLASIIWSVRLDGSEIARLEGLTVPYRFERAGLYQITLTVTDIWGNSASQTTDVNVLVRSVDTAYNLLVGLAFTGGGAALGAGLAVLFERVRRSRRGKDR